jgi:hypothetical protein
MAVNTKNSKQIKKCYCINICLLYSDTKLDAYKKDQQHRNQQNPVLMKCSCGRSNQFGNLNRILQADYLRTSIKMNQRKVLPLERERRTILPVHVKFVMHTRRAVKYNKFVNSAFLYLTEALLLRSTTL